MSDQDPLRVGVVGCGHQGGWLARAMTNSDAMRVAACADPDQDAGNRVAAIAGGANVYPSIEALLGQSDVDAVVVATPHDVLHEVSMTAIEAGKHVLAEKPIALNGTEAAEIEAAVARADICYLAGYSFRFFVALNQVHDLLAQGAVGEIQAVAASIGTRPMRAGWRSDPKAGGGALLYVGSHLVDELLWFLHDDPVTVYAEVDYRTDTQTDDTSAFQIRFAGGAVAQCMVTQSGDGFFNNVDIVGRDGRLDLRGSGFLSYSISVASSRLEAFSQPTTIRPRVYGDPILSMLAPELEEFAAAIHENRQPAVTASDGRRVLQVLDAVVEAGRVGAPVHLGDKAVR
jgi:predicted dehydrogenase